MFFRDATMARAASTAALAAAAVPVIVFGVHQYMGLGER